MSQLKCLIPVQDKLLIQLDWDDTVEVKSIQTNSLLTRTIECHELKQKQAY
jgi:hypothetical protein